MEHIFKKVCALIVLIIALVLLLSSSFDLFFKGFVRQHNAVEINENNIEYIEQLVAKYVDDEDDMPDIRTAEKISCLVLMHKDEINIEYSDGTTYRFFLRGAIISDLREYIMTEGYNCYFHSSEFLRDFVPFALCSAAFILCSVYLIRQIKRRKNKTENGENTDVI